MGLVKTLRNLKSMSDDQLKNRINNIMTEIIRERGKNTSPSGYRKGREDTMLLHRLKKEKAMILTILSERRKNRNRR